MTTTQATVTVLIGNSDDKLSQTEWSQFIASVERILGNVNVVHFSGFSNPCAPWQNACWVFALDEHHNVDDLKSAFAQLAKDFKQDSIAFVIGYGQLVTAEK